MFTQFILFAVLAALPFALFSVLPKDTGKLNHKGYRGDPQLAYADDDPLDPSEVQDFGSRDTNRIVGNISKALARSSPFVDILAGGNIPAGVSTTQRAIVQERAVLNQSMVRPAFVADTQMCGKTGEGAEVGTTEYDYQLETLRGMGPLVCVKGMRDTFEGSYMAAEDAMKKRLVELFNADVRILLNDRSGSKMVVKASTAFDTMFDGDMQRIDQPFPTIGAPDANLNFKLLEFAGQYLRETLLAETFDDDQEGAGVLKFICGQEQLNRLRDDIGVKTDHLYLAAGSYKIGEQTLRRYRWEGPYRGIALGYDPQPLRFSVLDGDGQPVLLEPEIAIETDNGVGSRPNPAWVRARYEIGLLMGQNAFRRLAPAQYTGEGSWKFPAQVSAGELQWRVILDNQSNVWGDFGRHYYQISRAYRPERPHAVCAIAYKRSNTDFGLSSVSDVTDYSSLSAL